MKGLAKLCIFLPVIALLAFTQVAHSQAMGKIIYTGSEYGYSCVYDLNSTEEACMTGNQNLTLPLGNYKLTAFTFSPTSSFSHWITQGNITVGNIQANNTVLGVHGDGYLAAIFYPSETPGVGNVKFKGVGGYVCFLNYSNSSGPVCLTDGQNVTLPRGSYLAAASPNNKSSTFLNWFTQGLIRVKNQTSYITNVTVSGNGVLGLIYTNPRPVPEVPWENIPIVLFLCLTLPVMFLRKSSSSRLHQFRFRRRSRAG